MYWDLFTKINCVPEIPMGKGLILLPLKAVNMYFRHHHSHIPNAAEAFPVTYESCLEGMGQV